MALRNAVKATLLLDEEPPRPRADDMAAIVDAPAPLAQPTSIATPRAAGDGFLAATWHQRAEALCAMAETLPSKGSWSLISKIAALYDEIARDAGWREEEEAAPSPDDRRCEEPPPENEPPAADEPVIADEPPLADEPPALAAPPVPERLAFPRRALPGRSMPRRRA